MTRSEKILEGIDLQTAVCIEIGALDKPICPSDSPHIFYVDHALTLTLKAKYQDDPNVDVDNLVQVSGVWGEASLAQAASQVLPVDFIVASHVIEHVPDVITWLQELASVLKPHGQVRLALPDKRYTFDLLRRESIAADVLAAHSVRARLPQPREILDYMTHLVDVDTRKLWDGSLEAQSAVRLSSIKSAMIVVHDSLNNGSYHDVHCWVFTPLSFALLMYNLTSSGYLLFECAGYHATERNTNEFFITLQLCSDSAQAAASWLTLAGTIQAGQDALTPQMHEVLAQVTPEVRRILETALNNSHLQTETLKGAIVDLQTDNNAQIEMLKKTIADFKASRSWRMTALFRSLSAWVQRMH